MNFRPFSYVCPTLERPGALATGSSWLGLSSLAEIIKTSLNDLESLSYT